MSRHSSIRLTAGILLLSSAACSDVVGPGDATSRRELSPGQSAHRVEQPNDLRTALSPQRLVRTKGAPNTFSFTVAGYGTDAVLHVRNGDENGTNRISSATITIDGREVVGPSSFSQSVSGFDIDVQIGNPATIEVRLASAPGSEITLSMDARGATGGSVGVAGGSVRLLATQVVLAVPAGAAGGQLQVTAAPLAVDPAQAGGANVVGGSAVELGPDGTQFTSPVTLTLQYDPAALPARFNQQALRLGTLVNGEWLPIRGSSVNVATHTVSGQTSHFSSYAVLGTETFVQTSVGDQFACGLTPLHEVYCWGRDRGGSLGGPAAGSCALTPTGTAACAVVPQLVGGGIQFQTISVGTAHACGLDAAGAAYCWGTNTNGQLGNGTRSNSQLPVAVVGGQQFTSITSGTLHSCGIATDASTYCWGDNFRLELGAPSAETCGTPARACSTMPIRVQTTVAFKSVQAGLTSVCALDATGGAWCWGTNLVAGLGDNTRLGRATPVAVLGGLTFASISTGAIHTCALTPAGAAYCWGDNGFAREIGIGSATPALVLVPAAVVGGGTFTSISASRANDVFTHACALTSAGGVYCWGSDVSGELGVAAGPETCPFGTLTPTCSSRPLLVASPLAFRSIAVGLEESCGVAMDGEMYCWGGNDVGQLGDGTTTGKSSPSHVLRPW